MCEMQFASSSKNYRRDDGLYAGSKIVEIMIINSITEFITSNTILIY